MQVECSHCKAIYECPKKYEGKPVRCNKCQEQFVALPHDRPVLEAISQASSRLEPVEKATGLQRLGDYAMGAGTVAFIISIVAIFAIINTGPLKSDDIDEVVRHNMKNHACMLISIASLHMSAMVFGAGAILSAICRGVEHLRAIRILLEK